MLRVERICTSHGRVQVLHEVSLAVNPGEIVAIIGANGAGKSTLMGSISGLYPIQSGQILLEGKPVHGLSAEQVVGRGISLVPEGRQVFYGLTVRENLVLGAYPRRGVRVDEVRADIEMVLDLFPPLRNLLGRLAGYLSGGEQQMLAVGRGLMGRPRVLLIDELSLGLAPLVVQDLLKTMVRLRDERGTTILMVEQNARAAMKVADRCLVLERGQVVAQGTSQELLADPRLEAAYLGKGYRALAAE